MAGACSAHGVEQRAGVLRSRHWPGREIGWRLAVPATREAVISVVIVLHGKGGSAAAAFDDLHLDQHVERTRLAVASVDGGDHYWHRRRSGVDTGAMVREEFMPVIRGETGYAGKLALLGWSMGGYGALLLASELGPDVVSAVVAESAALWTDAKLSAAGAFDGLSDFEAHDVFDRAEALRDIPIRLDCGRRDLFADANRAFASRTPSANLTIDDGDHTTEYWRSHAAAQLGWIVSTLRSARQ
jgi:pimeloyl-ACP methyl ester carboxylesterase